MHVRTIKIIKYPPTFQQYFRIVRVRQIIWLDEWMVVRVPRLQRYEATTLRVETIGRIWNPSLYIMSPNNVMNTLTQQVMNDDAIDKRLENEQRDKKYGQTDFVLFTNKYVSLDFDLRTHNGLSSLSCLSHIASVLQNNLIAWKGRS